MKVNLLILLFVVFSCEISFAYENIVIETKNDNLFENIVSDSLLLLDPDLQKSIEGDFAHVVANSKFSVPVNSWKPRPNPKNKLTTIYNRINGNNIKESFASLIQPVVELACTPNKYDPLNEVTSKCIKKLFKYPIIETIQIGYIFKSNKTIEQNISSLSNLNDRFRYHQIIWTIADIMNGAYERVSEKNVSKAVNLVKYPLAFVDPLVTAEKKFSASDQMIISNEKSDLESQISRKRMECHNTIPGSNDYCYKKKKELEALLEELIRNPEYYFEQKPVRAAEALAKARTEEQEARQARARAEEVEVNTGAINPYTGEFYAPAGDGYVSTRNGTYYAPAGPNGVVNTRTGEFSPLTR
ncbi:MAG: hypothetical protein PHR66_07900 [Desulfuromonadaceae bacterium]|nr:hypothetical protein [Desulfuromonadaceae bacterium]